MDEFLYRNADVEFIFNNFFCHSLPGYGFSSGATKPGLNPTKVAVIMNSLMTSLGYNRYLVQGMIVCFIFLKTHA